MDAFMLVDTRVLTSEAACQSSDHVFMGKDFPSTHSLTVLFRLRFEGFSE